MKVLVFGDSAGHINVYDISTDDKLRKIFNDIFTHFQLLDEEEVIEALQTLNEGDLERCLEYTGATFGGFREYIVELKTDIEFSYYD